MQYSVATESIFLKFPNLAKEWDYERNYPLTPQQVTQGSTKNVWWICPQGHSYDMQIYRRTTGKQNCPICANMRALPGYNDLLTKYPELAEEWDYVKNGELLPFQVLPKTNKVVWWICPKGHSYDLRIASRTSGKQGCPYCSGKRVLYGFNDLESQNPELAREWDYEKNGTLTPRTITAKSNKSVWWICSKGHSYLATVTDRNREDGKATGCPFCAGKKPIPGETDLQTRFPKIAAEWDSGKNDFAACDVMPFSMKKVWWLCEKGHSYQMRIADRTAKHQGCQYCANMRVLPGYNDLATVFPAVAAEWDYELNEKLPSQIVPGTHDKYNWICSKCGHKWKTAVKERTYSGTGCPKCTFYFHTSFQEQALLYYIRKIWPDTVNSYHAEYLKNKEIDIFVPAVRLAIEFDGGKWHADSGRDMEKSRLILENGNRLIRVREGNAPKIEDCSVQFLLRNCEGDSALEKTVEELLHWLQNEYDLPSIPTVNIADDRNQIQASYKASCFAKSVAADPNMMLEWDAEKNHPMLPECVAASSHDKYWWRCTKCGETWRQSPNTKRRGMLGCKSCISRERNAQNVANRVASGKTKTLDAFPELIEEWDWEANGNLQPHTISYGSETMVRWICKKCGHKFPMMVKSRTGQHQNCPKCGRIAGAEKRRKRKS